VSISTLPLNAEDAANSPFDEHSTAEEVTEGLDLSGKTALITGVNSGIGFETMRVLALRGAHVLGFARTTEKAEQACDILTRARLRGKATPFVCELADYDSVVSAAEAVRSLDGPLDMLICNAGVNVPTLEHVQGIEKHFAVQHLSHFILVTRLLDELKAATQGRVVMVSSFHYKIAPEIGIDFANLSGEHDEYDMNKMYGQSKLANGLFVRELTRRLSGTTVTANVLHPGLIPTNITHTWANDARTKARLAKSHGRAELLMALDHTDRRSFIKTVGQGAATTCYVATHPTLARVSGAYFEDCRIIEPEGHMRDDAMAAKLWSVSEQLTKATRKTNRLEKE
jgi:NAD(P)-dependent dehydrogenase (short-subunit alcohol dehydrogenase family)